MTYNGKEYPGILAMRRDHGRPYADLDWLNPETKQREQVSMRADYYDKRSEGERKLFTMDELQAFADGKTVRLQYTTSSGVDRDGSYVMGVRHSRFGPDKDSFGPIPAGKQSQKAVTAKDAIAEALERANKVSSNDGSYQTQKEMP